VTELVEKYGPQRWSYISNFLPGRIGKQCRERWYNHLNPYIKKCSWSKEEEWILWILHRRMGNKWSVISKFIEGRTDNTIKNYWNSTMKKRCKELSLEFNEIVNSGFSVEAVENELLEKSRLALRQDNQKFFEEKIKFNKKFKNSINNDKIKITSNLKTFGKKIKKRGRKRVRKEAIETDSTPVVIISKIRKV
jgi:hypothetical protein